MCRTPECLKTMKVPKAPTPSQPRFQPPNDQFHFSPPQASQKTHERKSKQYSRMRRSSSPITVFCAGRLASFYCRNHMVSLEKTIGPGRPSRAQVRTDYSPASVPGKGREYGFRPVLGKDGWTGRLGTLRTAVIRKCGGPCNVRNTSVEDCGGLRDCRVKFFAPTNNFLCQAEVGTCVKDNRRSVLFCFNRWGECTLIG